MAGVPEPPIISFDEWGGKEPRAATIWTGRPDHALIHGTAGHHPEIQNPGDESKAELIRYAKDLQFFHMRPKSQGGNGWNDSGHNFLIGRNGLIAVGRRHSLTAIRAGIMVVSAHCPGHNDVPGVEFEHLGDERLTQAQFHSGAWLYAFIFSRNRSRVTSIFPHSKFYPTACPTPSILRELGYMRLEVAKIITRYGYDPKWKVAAIRAKIRR